MRIRLLTLPLFCLAAFAAPALADAIDGEWCAGDGQRILIEGPRVVTPEGKEATGMYHRHSFAYEGLPGTADAGTVIYMDLLNEEEMRLFHVRDGQTSPVELWRRCQVTS